MKKMIILSLVMLSFTSFSSETEDYLIVSPHNLKLSLGDPKSVVEAYATKAEFVLIEREGEFRRIYCTRIDTLGIRKRNMVQKAYELMKKAQEEGKLLVIPPSSKSCELPMVAKDLSR